MIKIIALVGPTAVGKTGISHELVEKFPFEIVSCDSMQVYSGMDTGTAKPSKEERKKYHYNMIDVVAPDYHYSAGEYAHDAGKVIGEIVNRGKIPLVVGGSGLYLDALIYGISSMPEADPKFRKKLNQEAEEKGSLFLYEQLKGIDPDSAERIHPNDLKRIIRALEVYHLTGETISEIQKRKNRIQEYHHLIIGLNRKRAELYKRVEVRVEKMFEEGLVEEVKNLMNKGYNPELSSFQALGYKELIDCFNGKFDLEEAREKIKQSTRNFAKRQLTYFKKNKEIKWFELDEEKHKVLEEVERFLEV